MITDEGMKRLIEAAAAARISSEEAAEAFGNIPASSPVSAPPDRMTFEEILMFCKKRNVEIETYFDPFSFSFNIKMRKGRKANFVAVRAEDIYTTNYFPASSILTRMADELDAMPPEPPEAHR